MLALNSPGPGASQSLIGLGGGAVLWLAGTRRLGLLDELRRRVRR